MGAPKSFRGPSRGHTHRIVSRPKRTAPFGAWASPITADRIVQGIIGLGQVAVDGDDVYWNEMRPAEGGRNVIMRWRNGQIDECLPSPFSARTRAHEYGGGSYAVHHGTLFFSNDSDQRLYLCSLGTTPRALTQNSSMRYADGVLDQRSNRFICVCEDHSSTGEPKNSLVAIDLIQAGRTTTLASGHDFYAAPRLSPDGRQLAFLAWNHPHMPWDAAELWLADLSSEGSPIHIRHVAGSPDESICHPVFAPDGTLYFVSDRNNWWNLYRAQATGIESISSLQAEFGLPHWIFGQSTYAFNSAGQLVCAFNRGGLWQLGVILTDTLTFEEIETPFQEIRDVVAGNGWVVFVAGSMTSAAALIRLNLFTRQFEILRESIDDVPDPGCLAKPRSLEFPTSSGDVAHAWYYPPTNRDFQAPETEKPPLLVLSHGGPTAAASVGLNLRIQYWTSRGIAVLDVNYRGSTGYGRAYRRRLNGQWGVFDVEDCIAGARYAVDQGLADAHRLAIRGGSAGGFTTLCALTFHQLFRAGAVYYGVSDLEALALDTHKFEAHYLDHLIGPYPADVGLYRERSPIQHTARLSCPIIFFQGLEDKVVPPDQTEKMVEALRERKIPVSYLPFAGEQHGFRQADNIQRALEAEFYFYSRVFQFTPADSLPPIAIEHFLSTVTPPDRH